MKAFRLAVAAVTGLLAGYFIGEADMNRTIRAHDRAARMETRAITQGQRQDRRGCEGEPHPHFHPELGVE